MTSRNYCFTAWNMVIIPGVDFSESKLSSDRVKYICYGIETCPTTGKVHYQGYIELHTPMRMSAVKGLFNDNTVHLEKRKGTRDQAIDYCKKDGKFYSCGGLGLSTTLKPRCRNKKCTWYCKSCDPFCDIRFKAIADNRDMESWERFLQECISMQALDLP